MGDDGSAWFLRVGIFIVVLADFDEVTLSRRASILTPKTFEVDCADITAACLAAECSINLLEIVVGGPSIVLITANIIADVFHASLHGVIDWEGLA